MPQQAHLCQQSLLLTHHAPRFQFSECCSDMDPDALKQVRNHSPGLIISLIISRIINDVNNINEYYDYSFTYFSQKN